VASDLFFGKTPRSYARGDVSPMMPSPPGQMKVIARREPSFIEKQAPIVAGAAVAGGLTALIFGMGELRDGHSKHGPMIAGAGALSTVAGLGLFAKLRRSRTT
jgi:hypothetical protein